MKQNQRIKKVLAELMTVKTAMKELKAARSVVHYFIDSEKLQVYNVKNMQEDMLEIVEVMALKKERIKSGKIKK